MSFIADGKAIMDTIQGIASKLKSRELDEEIRKLYSIIHAANDEALVEKERRLRVEDRVRELEAERTKAKNLILKEAMIWELNDKNEPTGPYCSACHATGVGLVPLRCIRKEGLFDCPKCNNQFRTDAYRDNPPNSTVRLTRM